MPPAKRQQIRFRERAELLDFLLEVSAGTSETLDLNRLLANVADYVKEVIPHDLFAILLYSEQKKGLRMRYARGHRDEVVRSLVLPLGEGVTGTAAETRQAVLIEDVRRSSIYLNALDAVRSELAVPMMAAGKLVGVIDLQSTRPKGFSPQDQALLQLIASRVASSIDNARLHRRVKRSNRTLRTLAKLSREFSAILDLDTLLGKIAKTLRTLISYDAFSLMLVDEERGLLRRRFSVRYDKRLTMDHLPMGKGVTGAAVLERAQVKVDDVGLDPRYIDANPGIRSELATPLMLHDRVVGVLDLESERINYFTDDHQRLLTLLAPQIASSVENARLYEELALREQKMNQDLQAASKLQSILLPGEPPEIEGLEMALAFRPCNQVSGDLYDFFEYGEGQVLFAFGDVSGKGAAAALYGALVSGLLRTLAPRRWGPARLMRALNEKLLERKVDAQYVTLLLLLYDKESGRFTMANAGSLPPVIYRDGVRMPVKVEGVPVGLLEDREYDQKTFDSQPGDLMVLTSDGVQDQVNGTDEEYGRRRLFEKLSEIAREPAQRVLHGLLEDLDAFQQGVPMTDDQTVLVIRTLVETVATSL